MNVSSKNKIIIIGGVVLVLLAVLFGNRDKTEPVALDQSAQCEADLKAQADYLQNENYSSFYTFDRYQVPAGTSFSPLGLDPNSSRYAAEFKTRLKEELTNQGVNFAGHYSLVSVGMTGWGPNYFIIDRKNGQAYEFPYHAISLEFQKDSGLIIMNSKGSIQKLLTEQPEGGCYFLNQEKVSDLRPFYFEWKDGKLSLLAPTDILPPVNAFWIDYFSDIVDGTPEHLAYFIHEAKEKVIAKIGRIPHGEGYTGFMLMEAFPGVVPEDFIGVNTPYGSFGVENGALQFMGNAPSNAAAMTTEGMKVLLENISRRLSLPAASNADVDVILKKISFQNEAGQDIASKRATLTGTYVPCLPQNDNFSSDPCVIGMRTDDGSYYAVDFYLMSQLAPELKPGDRFMANGVLTPIEMMSSDYAATHLGKGVFSVTDSVKKL